MLIAGNKQHAQLTQMFVTQPPLPVHVWVQAVFREGDRVVGLLSKLGDKLQLSTMEIEQTVSGACGHG